MQTLRQKNGISGYTCRSESEFDPFGAGHGCNSISAGLGIIFFRLFAFLCMFTIWVITL